MSTITKIDRRTLEMLRGEITEALQALATKHGISLKAGSGKFSNGSHGTVAIEIATIGESGMVESREASDFRMLGGLYGFQPDDLGRTFIHPMSREAYVIKGLRAKATKNPIMATNAKNGKDYLFPQSVAKYVQR